MKRVSLLAALVLAAVSLPSLAQTPNGPVQGAVQGTVKGTETVGEGVVQGAGQAGQGVVQGTSTRRGSSYSRGGQGHCHGRQEDRQGCLVHDDAGLPLLDSHRIFPA